jgi:hypothetical protein
MVVAVVMIVVILVVVVVVLVVVVVVVIWWVVVVVEVVVGHLRNRSFSDEQPAFFFDFFEAESSGASDFGVPGGVTNGTGLERREARDNW